MYGYTKTMLLLSLISRKYKAVILIFSMHNSDDNPETVFFYSATKSGVDTLDYKCSN